MKRPTPGRARGFTLIELIIVTVIVAILASVALSSYQSGVRKARRTEARVALSVLSQQLERCLTQFGSYNDAACVVPAASETPQGHYRVALVRTASTFSITAFALNGQMSDKPCATFSIDNFGSKTATASGGAVSTDCW